MSFVLELRDVAKSFTLHLHGGMQLSIVTGVTFSFRAGECIVLSDKRRALSFGRS
jgi:alpha-D-ribose 1-methylphosphonate 5-triphosphate synthase subunit PhnL